MMLKKNSTHAVLKVNDILLDRTRLDEVVPTMSSILGRVQQNPCSQLGECEVVATQEEVLIEKTRPIGVTLPCFSGN
jgi:hypothetical protein